MTPPQIHKQRSWSKTNPERAGAEHATFEVRSAALGEAFSPGADGCEPAAALFGNFHTAVAAGVFPSCGARLFPVGDTLTQTRAGRPDSVPSHPRAAQGGRR